MDNRFEILNDQEQAMRMMLDGRQVGIWTALPGILTAINFTAMTCTVQPALKAVIVDKDGVEKAVNLPLLLDVPIVFPAGGGFMVTMPLAVNDEVLVIFASRCIDAWFQSGGIQQAMESRMHDLSDGFAIPGPFSTPKIPAGAVSSTNFQIRNALGTTVFQIGANTKFKIQNPAENLNTVLQTLITHVQSLATACAAITVTGVTAGGGTSGVPSNAAAITALAASLATDATALGLLLE